MQKIDLAYIIDDDEILVLLMKMLMKRNPFYEDTQEFYNGEDAMYQLKNSLLEGKSLPNVILLDLNMPMMDGWQFLDEFIQMSLPKDIPVFLVTSSIDPRDIEHAKEYSVVKGYIMKPVDEQKLNDIFEKVTLLS